MTARRPAWTAAVLLVAAWLCVAALPGPAAAAPVAAPAVAAPAVAAPAAVGAALTARDRTALDVTNPRSLDQLWAASGDPALDTEAERAPLRHAYEQQMVTALVEAGVTTVRLEFTTDGRTALGTQLAVYDNLLALLKAKQIKVMALLSFGVVEGGVVADAAKRADYADQFMLCPTSGTSCVAGRYGAPKGSKYTKYGTPSTYLDEWTTRALAVVSRFRGSVTAVEVLNEANKRSADPAVTNGLPYWFLTPAVYGQVLATFADACLRASGGPCRATSSLPAVQIVTLGMHPATDDGGDAAEVAAVDPANPAASCTADPRVANNDWCYLHAVWKSTAVAKYKTSYGGLPLDGFGYHPYPFIIDPSLRTYADTLDADIAAMTTRMGLLRTVLGKDGDGSRAIWITEIGLNANDVHAPNDPETNQARFVDKVLTTFLADTRYRLVTWHRYQDNADTEKWGVVAFRGDDFRVLPPRYKPAYCTFLRVRGIAASVHCPRTRGPSFRIPYYNNDYTVIGWSAVPSFQVDQGSVAVDYEYYQVEYTDGTRQFTEKAGCYVISGVCNLSSGNFSDIPSGSSGSWRWRLRHLGDWYATTTDPWTAWVALTPLLGSAPDVYGPVPGQQLDFAKLVGLPIALPVSWISAHPGAVPYVRLSGGTSGGGTRWYLWRPYVSAVGSSFGTTADGAYKDIGVSPAPGDLSFAPGTVTVEAALAPAECRTTTSACQPVDPGQVIRRSYVQP